MSSSLKQQQKQRINQALFAIHKDLSRPWTTKPLAELAAYSPHHFHRIFKAVVGETLNDYIRRTRLERAANMLIFHRHIPITELAERCGFKSASSFTHRFKSRFGDTPSHWRAGGYDGYVIKTAAKHQDDEISQHLDAVKSIELPPVSIVQREAQRVAYVRHLGYSRSISHAWQRLWEWSQEEHIRWKDQEMLGLYHSNPNIVPLPQCRYVACLSVPETTWRRQHVGIMTIPGGFHAKVHVTGHYGDLLPVLHKLLHEWLPNSQYTMALTPAFACYQRNQFLTDDESFELDLYLPIKTY
jgi:AraC family transcriptional regulator